MDSFTHGLAAALVAYALGLPGLVPFAVAGAVIPDADTFVGRAVDRRPSFYLVTHGGITHSVGGAALLALPACAVAALVAPAVPLFPPVPAPAALAAALAGALLHLALDWLASPGIPLLAPASDRKYSLDLLPGPSLILFLATVALLAGVVLGADPLAAVGAYVAVAAAFVAVRLAAFGLVRVRAGPIGRYVPTVSPFRWLLIGETNEAWTVGESRLGRGASAPAVHPKYRGTTAGEAAPYLAAPEARRVRYHSYITTVAREGDALVVADPLRASRAVRYPPYFVEARIPIRETAD